MLFGWFKKGAPKREIVVNVEKLETRVAVVENGRVEEFQVEHPTEERLVGSIYKGRIQNLEHDLQAAFVDIGMKKNAFLHYWDMLPDDDSRLDDDEENVRPSRRRRISNDEIAKRFPPGVGAGGAGDQGADRHQGAARDRQPESAGTVSGDDAGYAVTRGVTQNRRCERAPAPEEDSGSAAVAG